jgi:23S rRNA (adenine2030-N6)-methyltransferase
MNYRHAYHAGNFADAFKHLILIALVQSFLRKDSGFCYLETHAGSGCYDLNAPNAQKSKEYESGVVKILAAHDQPKLVQDYAACIKELNHKPDMHYYPGSPFFARHFMRPQDRMVLSELHPEDYEELKSLFKFDRQVAVHMQDGYLSLKALLPPKERRGLVLIDPPYENPMEFSMIANKLDLALSRWETGTYAVWYPIKTHQHLTRFYRDLKNKIKHPMLTVELMIHHDDVGTQLNGCGMVIINPPWQLDQQLEALLPWLWNALSVNKQGKYSLQG